MSGKRNIPNDGQALTTPDVQRIGDNAAAMDDRVYENLMTPPSLGAKTITPLGIETAAVNPRLLCVPGAAAGTVQLQPCLMQVGSPSLALVVALAKTLQSALASALFGANASGATRYDLVYATLQRTVTLTGARAIKSTADGSIAVNPSVNLQDEPSLTLTILPNVGNVTPLATMPADNNGGANGEPFGSYNFPIALVALPNGYASAGVISQAIITPLWAGNWVRPSRVRGYFPASIYSSAAGEKSLTAALMSDRQGSFRRMFADFRNKTSTPTASGSAVILDNTIDWRNRLVVADVVAETTALFQVTTGGVSQIPSRAFAWTGAGNVAADIMGITYNGGASTIHISCDAAGVLRFWRTGAPNDGANGDFIALLLDVSDQFVA